MSITDDCVFDILLALGFKVRATGPGLYCTLQCDSQLHSVSQGVELQWFRWIGVVSFSFLCVQVEMGVDCFMLRVCL